MIRHPDDIGQGELLPVGDDSPLWAATCIVSFDSLNGCWNFQVLTAGGRCLISGSGCETSEAAFMLGREHLRTINSAGCIII